MKSVIKKILSLPYMLLISLPYFKFIRDTKKEEPSIDLRTWFMQKIVGFNKHAYWPMHHSSIVSYPLNVYIGKNTNPGQNPGCYIHAVNKIYVGDYTQIAPNVGFMSGNHDLFDYRIQVKTNKPIKIGKHCWLGMGVVIMPEVELGDFTIVGAGAIVTKSFPEGRCIVVGNPARKLRDLDADDCKYFETENPYNGYIHPGKFELFRKAKLYV